MDDENNDMYIYPLSTKDEETIEMISDKHADQSTDIDYDHVMSILNQIVHCSCFETVSEENSLQQSDNSFSADIVDMPETIREIINKLMLLIGHKYDPDMDVQELAIRMLDILRDYTWEAKMVLILAAFVAIFGELSFLSVQRTPENPLANLLSVLYNRPVQQTRWEYISSSLTPISNLVRKLLEVCILVIQFKRYRDQHNVSGMETKVSKVLLMATYQFTKIVATCSPYKESAIMESSSNIYRQHLYLKELFDTHQFVTEFMTYIASQEVQISSQTKYQNVHKSIANLFTKEKPLNGGKTSLKELNGKSFAFLVSDLNVSIEKFTALEQTYRKINKEKDFKVVWIPMVDPTMEWTDIEEENFREISRSMPWYYCHPSMVTEAFYTNTVKEWQYHKDIALVVLDEKANVINTNALSLVETWGASSFPFSYEMEANKTEKLTISRLVEDLGILQTDSENDIVCIYGGSDLQRLKFFTQNIEKVNSKKSTQIKAVYVGTSGEKETLTGIIETLKEMNATCLSDNEMSMFWNRLAGEVKLRTANHSAYDQDDIVKQLITLLEDNKHELWTTIAYKGSTEFIESKASKL